MSRLNWSTGMQHTKERSEYRFLVRKSERKTILRNWKDIIKKDLGEIRICLRIEVSGALFKHNNEIYISITFT
jgi:hypothetical protein